MTDQEDAKVKLNVQKASSVCKLSTVLHRWVKPVYNRRGFVEHRIITHWPEIIGQTLMLYCVPKRVMFPSKEKVEGTLLIEVFNSALATELQHMEPIIIEKIATYFGYNVVAHIKIIQNVKQQKLFVEPLLPPQVNKISQKKRKVIEDQTKEITDPKLKEKLVSLGVLISKKEK